MFRRFESLLIFRMSESVRGVCWIPPLALDERRMTLLAMMVVLGVSYDRALRSEPWTYWNPLDPCPPPLDLYTPTNCIRSPGLHQSTRSSANTTSTPRGN